MTTERPKAAAFSASVLLHGGLLTAIFIVAYAMKDMSPTPATDVQPFVMVGMGESHPAPNQPQGVTPSPANLVSFIPPPPVVRTPTVNTPVEPAVVENPPSPHSIADQPRPKPTPVRMTFGDYQVLHPSVKPRPTSVLAPSTVSAGKPTHININEVLGRPGAANGNSVNAPAATGSVGDIQLAAYESELLRRLRAALIKPPGAMDALTTRVSFHLASDGTLSQVVITKSSGDRAFDSAVLAAFSRVVSIGRVPTGKGEDLTLTFRMIEED